ncbi:MAG: hypothetical protein ACI8T1_000157 [Verrucomicrobiales bacterium]|jgi:uncharacterized protein (DUF2062 family)
MTTNVANPEMSFFSRRIVSPIKTQITQGVSPRAISWAIASGAISGIFPILGSTTILVALTGFVAKLNQPVLHTFNWLVYPIQIIALPFFVRAGEFVFRANPVPFSVSILIERFREDPMQFMRDFGMSGVHGIVAWCLIAPILAIIIVAVTHPLLESAARRWKTS